MTKFSLLFVILSNWYHLIYATPSGIYIDNGEDQTVLYRSISENELSTFKRDMSEFLGLPQKSRRKRRTTISESAAPKFLLDIYNSLEGADSDHSIGNEFNLKKEDIRSIVDSDSIMTFLTKEHGRHERRSLWFDVSDVPVGSTILGAEVRVFKFRGNDVEKYTLTMHQILINLKGEKELGIVDAVNVSSNYEGWLIFNVSSPFQSWIAFPSTNRGLYLSIRKHYSPDLEMGHEMAGLRSSGVLEGMKRRRPFLVGFFKNDVGGTNSKKRRPRDISNKHKSENNAYSNFKQRMTKPSWDFRSCQLQTLYVNFRDLKWHDWVIAPDGFAAYFCAGQCEFPLSVRMNATNHAIVQTLAHLLAIAPKPACCAPKTYGSLSLLYYIEDNNVILKRLKNMVVTSCGCH